MRKIKRNKFRSDFKNKLLLSYIVFILISALFSITYWMIQVQKEQDRASFEVLSMRLNTVSDSFNDILDSIKPIQYMHINNATIESCLSDIHDPQNELSLTNIAQAVLESNQYIQSIIYVDQAGDWVSSNKYIEKISFASMRSVLQDRHGIPYIGKPVLANEKDNLSKVIPIYKELYGKNGRSFGYIIINLDFNAVVSAVDLYNDQLLHLILFDTDGSTIYQSNHRDLYDMNLDNLNPSSFEQTTISDSTYYTYKYGKSSLYGTYNKRLQWYIIFAFIPQHYSPIMNTNVFIYICLTIICMFVMCLIAWKISYDFSKNMTLLSRTFQKSNGLNLIKIDAANINDDEIGDLILNYNEMVDKLQLSLNNEYRSTIQKQELRLKMLGYQINPHFLYNCLNMINSLAIINNVPDISTVSRTLASMYRYSLSNGDFVTIGDELSQVLDYIEIQKKRFQNTFDIDIDISASLLDRPCMKFIMQPIIENCFSHGLFTQQESDVRSGSSFRAKIDLIIYESEHIISIICKDNGSGIDSDTLSHIRQQLNASFDEPHSSIGLWNIQQRIKTFYGDSYGLTIESIPNQYTTVTLTYPYT